MTDAASLPATEPLQAEMVWKEAKAKHESGEAVTFMLETFHKRHVGDELAAMCLILSYASKYVEESKGIHITITGPKGTGKSDSANSILRQIPAEYVCQDELSDRAFYYNKVLDGTVFLLDDQTLSDIIQETIKKSSTDNRQKTGRKTVSNGKGEQLEGIVRPIWWLIKTETVGDDQILDRCLNVPIDDGPEQREAIIKYITQCAKGEAGEDDALLTDEHTCRQLWQLLTPKSVRVPFADNKDVQDVLYHLGNRDAVMFLDVIRCFAVLHNREDRGGYLEATEEDFACALDLYQALDLVTGAASLKLTKIEYDILRTVQEKGWHECTITQLTQEIHVDYQTIYRALNGRESHGTAYPGLLGKVPGIGKVNRTETDFDNFRKRESDTYYTFSTFSTVFHNFSTPVENQKNGDNQSIFQTTYNNKKYIYNIHRSGKREPILSCTPSSTPAPSPVENVENDNHPEKNIKEELSELRKNLDKGDSTFSTVVENCGKPVVNTFPPWLKTANCRPLVDKELRYLKPYCDYCRKDGRKAKAAWYDQSGNNVWICESCYQALKDQEARLCNNPASAKMQPVVDGEK